MKTDGKFIIQSGQGITQAIQKELGLSNEECKELQKNSVWSEIIKELEDPYNLEEITNNNGIIPNKSNNYTVYKNAVITFSKECWGRIVALINNAIGKNIQVEDMEYDETGNINNKGSSSLDGYFGPSSQEGEGNCYFMATINALRNLTKGQVILSKLVKKSNNNNGETVYTVTLPGAQKAANALKSDPRVKANKIAITGSYSFTEKEIKEILRKAGDKYSKGDADVILLEAAFERYRKEVKKTIDLNNIKPEDIDMHEVGLVTSWNESDILAAGDGFDAMFVLTGKQSDVYFNYNDNKYGLSESDLYDSVAKTVSTKHFNNETNALSSIKGKIQTTDSQLDKMLDKISKDMVDGKIDYAVTAALNLVYSDGQTMPHVFTVKAISGNRVTLINPWYPDKELIMSRSDFKKCLKTMSIADFSSL